MCSIVCISTQVSAQFPCDITSSGVQLKNAAGDANISNLFVNGAPGVANFVLYNGGDGNFDGSACSYAVGKVKVTVSFVPSTFASYYFRYGGATNTFSTAKYDWTYTPANSKLIGVNNAPIVSGDLFGAEIVNVPIIAVAAGTTTLPVSISLLASASGDNPGNNAFDLPITVLPAANGPLPVQLESIDGLGDKCNAQLKWKTSYELNLKKFEVEVSKDGISFDRAGTVNPSNAVDAGMYQFNTTQSSGVNYYRLKIIDKDGSFVYSKVVPISTSCSDKVVKVFPNPVKADQLLSVNISGYDASVKGDLYSSTGQFVKSYVLRNGSNTISVENLAQGFYTLKVLNNGAATETFKINVLR